MTKSKTHWLQSPNKNYLGHWDLPENEDLTLTIKSAKWEEVKNPIINRSEAKRVIRFEENYKPLICNQTNAQSIIKSTGVKFMEDSKGCRIQLHIGKHKDRVTKEDVDCIRVRSTLKMNASQVILKIQELFDQVKEQLSDREREYVLRIIDNQESLSYDKALKFLTNKSNGSK